MVTQQMAMMEPIYVLFEQQLTARELWGETLWKDLNVQILQEGIDGFLMKARKLNKAIRAQPVWAVGITDGPPTCTRDTGL